MIADFLFVGVLAWLVIGFLAGLAIEIWWLFQPVDLPE